MAYRHALRHHLTALGASGALVASSLALAGSASAADAAPAVASVSYDCTQKTLLGIPTGRTAPLTLELPGLADRVTVPLGGALDQVTGTLGLTDLVAALGTTVGALLGSVEGLVFHLGDVPLEGSLSGSSLTIPGFPLPDTVGDVPLTAPDQFVITSLGGLLGTVTCTVDPLDKVLTTVLIRQPGAPADDPSVPQLPTGPGAEPGPQPGPSGPSGPGSSGVEPTRTAGPASANPCLTLPAPRAGQRRTVLKVARPAKVTAHRRPLLKVRAKARKHPARGRVIACYGAVKVGQARLKHGTASLRITRFGPGRHRVKVVYLGAARARAAATTVKVRVRR